MKKRALLSVTDKRGLAGFATELANLGFELVSTGGTAKALREAGLTVIDVSEMTGFPEMLDGRVKTLHPGVHAGLLADLRLEPHRTAIVEASIEPISLLCVNLYAFEQTVNKEHSLEEAIESIDIGGPAMIRSAAKNHANVIVVVSPDDYDFVLQNLEATTDEFRRGLAAKAFRHTAFYDSMVARYLTEKAGLSNLETETLTLGFRRKSDFRYAENPHQKGALYQDPLGQPGIADAEQLWGIEAGYNNWNDADGAWELVADLPPISCAITKHGNPCGAATAESFADAFRLAKDADPISAFGGVVVVNGVLDEGAAIAMTEKGNKLDVIVATAFDPEALKIFQERSGWGKDVRLLTAPLPPAKKTIMLKTVRGGALAQESDEDPDLTWKVVTKRQPSEEEMAAMRFLWKIVPYVKSNGIVVGSANRLLGVGAGQMNRVQSVRLAVQQAGDRSPGLALASDAMFPFPDGIEAAGEAGVLAVVQTGGSKKDPDVIAAADRLGMTMCFTGSRHFKH